MAPVLMGRANGLFGVRGWLKVYSYADPPANILSHPDWLLRQADGDWRPMRLVEGRKQGKGLVAHLAPENGPPLADRDAAAALLGADIAIPRDVMPDPAPGQVYWADLIGCQVQTLQGNILGRVVDMMDTGVHGVMVILGDEQHLVPMVRGPIVKKVDLDAALITVDWE